MRTLSRLVAKSGRAEILKLMFWTGIFEILAKTLVAGLIDCALGLKYFDTPESPCRCVI